MMEGRVGVWTVGTSWVDMLGGEFVTGVISSLDVADVGWRVVVVVENIECFYVNSLMILLVSRQAIARYSWG